MKSYSPTKLTKSYENKTPASLTSLANQESARRIGIAEHEKFEQEVALFMSTTDSLMSKHLYYLTKGSIICLIILGCYTTMLLTN